jgi:hypothetical protein
MKYNELEKDQEGSGHNLISLQSHNNSGGAKENHNKPQDTSAPGKIQTEHLLSINPRMLLLAQCAY